MLIVPARIIKLVRSFFIKCAVKPLPSGRKRQTEPHPGSQILDERTSYQERSSACTHTRCERQYLPWLQDRKYPDRVLQVLPMAYNEANDGMRMERGCCDSFQSLRIIDKSLVVSRINFGKFASAILFKKLLNQRCKNGSGFFSENCTDFFKRKFWLFRLFSGFAYPDETFGAVSPSAIRLRTMRSSFWNSSMVITSFTR